MFERLVAWADVYVTNQLPRVRRKLRTEPADLFAINPRLVFARGSGQGQRGADAEAGGYDAVSYWARGGVSHVLTAPDAATPTPQRPALGDIPSGAFLAGGICAALVHTLRTGTGIVVDTSLLNGAVWTLGPDMAYASLAGAQLPAPADAARSPVTQTYRTADGRFVTLMMIDEARYWGQACRAVGLEELIDTHPDPATRRADWTPLTERFRAVISGLDRDELEQRLRAEGCIYSFFQTPPEVIHDPAVVDNGYVMAHPEHPALHLSAAPAQFDDELPTMRRGGRARRAHRRGAQGARLRRHRDRRSARRHGDPRRLTELASIRARTLSRSGSLNAHRGGRADRPACHSDHAPGAKVVDRRGVVAELAQDRLGVLADGRDGIEALAETVEDRRWSQRGDRPDGGVDLAPAIALGELRVGDQVGDVVLAGVGDLCRVEALDHVLRAHRREDLLDQFGQLHPLIRTPLVGDEPRIGGDLRPGRARARRTEPTPARSGCRTAPSRRRRWRSCRRGTRWHATTRCAPEVGRSTA